MKYAVLLFGLGLCGAAAATQAPITSESRMGPRNDPDEIMCINEAVIGSRLSRRRVCRTRAEWEEHRAQSRIVTERVQLQKQTGNQ